MMSSSSIRKMAEQTRLMAQTNVIANFLTCYICSKIQRDSTTITECIHSFCKKCITKKITEEELRSCPVCQTDLGVNPLENLRADHNLQSLAANFFHSCKMNTNIMDDDGDDEEEGEEEEEAYKPAPAPPVPVEQRKKPRGRPNKSIATVAQAVVDVKARDRKLDSIWLSLVATNRQDTGLPLPQIPSTYIRIKDVHAPVSFLKKYLVRKLNLDCEDEIEIELRGLKLPDNMELCYLIDLWGQAVAASEIISTTVGSSAKDYVIDLSYSRKSRLLN